MVILHRPGSWSESWKAKLLSESLTVEDLDQIAEDFVAAANEGQHKDKGFPGAKDSDIKMLYTLDVFDYQNWIGIDMTAKNWIIFLLETDVFPWLALLIRLWYFNQILKEKG